MAYHGKKDDGHQHRTRHGAKNDQRKADKVDNGEVEDGGVATEIGVSNVATDKWCHVHKSIPVCVHVNICMCVLACVG
jgi:hypothetical protein